MRRRYVSAVAGARVVPAIMASTVSAHECFVVNRSAQGNAGASHSGEWFTLTLGQLFSETENFGLPDLTGSQVDWAVARRSRPAPASFTIRTDKTIGEDAAAFTKNGHASDGKGIDHFIDVYGNTIIGIVFEAAGHDRAGPGSGRALPPPRPRSQSVHPGVERTGVRPVDWFSRPQTGAQIGTRKGRPDVDGPTPSLHGRSGRDDSRGARADRRMGPRGDAFARSHLGRTQRLQHHVGRRGRDLG